jgi:hypothetical protein
VEVDLERQARHARQEASRAADRAERAARVEAFDAKLSGYWQDDPRLGPETRAACASSPEQAREVNRMLNALDRGEVFDPATGKTSPVPAWWKRNLSR